MNRNEDSALIKKVKEMFDNCDNQQECLDALEKHRKHFIKKNRQKPDKEVIMVTNSYAVLFKNGIVDLRDWFKHPTQPTEEECITFKSTFNVDYMKDILCRYF